MIRSHVIACLYKIDIGEKYEGVTMATIKLNIAGRKIFLGAPPILVQNTSRNNLVPMKKSLDIGAR